MAFSANRNNIHPVFFGIAKVMMVFVCFFRATKTVESLCRKNFFRCDSTRDCNVCHPLLRVFFSPKRHVFFDKRLSFFTCTILFLGNTISFCSPIFGGVDFSAIFTLRANSTPSISVNTETRNRFDFLASATSFCYNGVSHIRTSLRLWLKPFTSNELVTGLFYYIVYQEVCQ